ncbi:MAG: TolC family protein, partial [Bacteroidetes bacterium]|nr:TolC family protein [Bacteroidota bacterium]
MNEKKIFIYTVLVFIGICFLSYAVQAQEPLSLQKAVSLAVAHNREVKAADVQVQRTQQQQRVAKSLTLPTVTAGAQASHYFWQPVFFGLDGNTTKDKIAYGRFGGKDQAAATLAIVQPLYNAQAAPALRSARLQEKQDKASLEDRTVIIAAEVKQTYWQIVVLNERLRLQNESLARNRKALEDAKSLLAQGRALRVDTLRAYTSVKNLEPDLLRLTYAMEVGKLQLKVLMGLDSLQEIQLSDSLIVPTTAALPVESEIYAEAIRSRPDLQALVLQPQIDDQQIAIANAARKPSLSAVAQYQVQTQVNRFNYLEGYYPSVPFVGLQFSVPLFAGFSNLAKTQQAKLGKQQSILRRDNAFEQLRADVHQVLADLQETTARIQTRLTVKETAQLSYDITQYRYARGVASRLELTDAELALTTAQSNYLEAV